MHNFWALILMTHVQYENKCQKLGPRSPRVQYNNCYLAKENWIMPKNKIDMLSQYVVDGIVIIHIPKKISFLCAVFIKRGGTIQCIVSVIYHRIFPHLDFLLWCGKIVGRMLLSLEVSL